MKAITLKPGKERALQRGHPWIYDTAVAWAPPHAETGAFLPVHACDGRHLAWAAWSPASRLRARVWRFGDAPAPDRAWLAEQVQRAVALRQRLHIPSDALRLVHGEADGLPGLVVDRYADTLVAQFLSSGAQRHKAQLADALMECTGARCLYERSDSSSRALEGLSPETGWLRGGGPDEQAFLEHGWRFTADIAAGHKTGFYLDQRDNRGLFADLVRRSGATEVLNCYCYTGGFTVAALAGGSAHVTSVDSSAPALARARQHVAANGLPGERCTWLDADVNATLRELLRQGRRFDAIVLDPPKLAPSAAHAARAARAYKDINRLALRLLRPGGWLWTFSCSGGVSADLFHKIVAGAAIDAEVDGPIVHRLGAAPDHPATLFFPEGEYLKGLVIMRRP